MRSARRWPGRRAVGASALIDREYRYISAEYEMRQAGDDARTWEVLWFVGASLVNRPGFDLPALAAAASAGQEGNEMNIRELLGLAPEASDEEVADGRRRVAGGPRGRCRGAQGAVAGGGRRRRGGPHRGCRRGRAGRRRPRPRPRPGAVRAAKAVRRADEARGGPGVAAHERGLRARGGGGRRGGRDRALPARVGAQVRVFGPCRIPGVRRRGSTDLRAGHAGGGGGCGRGRGR